MASSYIVTENISKLSNLSKKIIDWIFDKQSKSNKALTVGIYPETFISLDELSNLVKSNSSLTEGEKTEKAINEALSELLDEKNEGREPKIYLYPLILIRDNKIQAKIALIAPQSESRVEITPYRKASFDFSKNTIEKVLDVLNQNVYGLKSDNYLTGKKLVRKNEKEEIYLNPEVASIEKYFGEIISKAFHPFHQVPQKDFIEDVLKFARDKRGASQVYPEVHLLNSNSKEGADLHFKEHFYGLELFLFTKSKDIADANTVSAIQKYQDAYSKDKSIPNETKKEELISISKTLSSRPEFANDRASITKVQQIIEELWTKVKQQAVSQEKEWVNQSVEHLGKRISDHTNTTSTMLLLNLDEIVEAYKITEKEELVDEFAKIAKSQLLSKYASEVVSSEGRFTVLTADPGYLIKVVYNLKLQSMKNPAILDQYKIAKKVYNKFEELGSIVLNAKLDPAEREELKRKLRELEGGKKQEQQVATINVLAAGITGILTFIGGVIGFILGEEFQYLLIGLGLAPILGLAAGFILRKRPEAEIAKDANKNNKASTLLKIAEEVVYKTGTPIPEQLRTKESLEKIISKNLDLLRKKYPPFTKEEDDDKVINTVLKILITNCVQIRIGKDILPEGKSSPVYIKKSDFKSKVFRENLVKYLEDEMSVKKKKENYEKYLGFLIHAIQIDYPRYLKSN